MSYKACGDGDDIKLVMVSIFQLDTSLSKLSNGVILDVNDIYVRPIELLVVVLLEAWPLDAEEMRRFERRKNIALSRISNAGSLILCPEVVGFTICFCVVEHVLVVAQPIPEAAMVPKRMVECFSFFLLLYTVH